MPMHESDTVVTAPWRIVRMSAALIVRYELALRTRARR
jgi:hypothetical protein